MLSTLKVALLPLQADWLATERFPVNAVFTVIGKEAFAVQVPLVTTAVYVVVAGAFVNTVFTDVPVYGVVKPAFNHRLVSGENTAVAGVTPHVIEIHQSFKSPSSGGPASYMAIVQFPLAAAPVDASAANVVTFGKNPVGPAANPKAPASTASGLNVPVKPGAVPVINAGNPAAPLNWVLVKFAPDPFCPPIKFDRFKIFPVGDFKTTIKSAT